MENRVCNCHNNNNNNKDNINRNNKIININSNNISDHSNISENNNQVDEINDTATEGTPISYSIYHYLERTIRAVVLLVGRVLATVYSYSISVSVREAREPLGQLSNCKSCSGTMVKKRQTDAQQDGSSWTDSGEEELVNGHAGAGSSATSCQHIKKAVDPTRLRRHLKSTGLLYDCQMCQKLNPPNDSGADSTVCEYDNTLWLCLKCGTQLCSRERNKHALLHYQVTQNPIYYISFPC